MSLTVTCAQKTPSVWSCCVGEWKDTGKQENFREGLYSSDRQASYPSFLQEGANMITIGCGKFIGNDSDKMSDGRGERSLWVWHSWEGWG